MLQSRWRALCCLLQSSDRKLSPERVESDLNEERLALVAADSDHSQIFAAVVW